MNKSKIEKALQIIIPYIVKDIANLESPLGNDKKSVERKIEDFLEKFDFAEEKHFYNFLVNKHYNRLPHLNSLYHSNDFLRTNFSFPDILKLYFSGIISYFNVDFDMIRKKMLKKYAEKPKFKSSTKKLRNILTQFMRIR